MVLMNWWMIPAWLTIALVAVFTLRYLRTKQKQTSGKHSVKVAHGMRFKRASAYEAVRRKYVRLVWVAAVCIVACLILAIGLSARPATLTIEQPDQRNRDIMLCLDISGSMTRTDISIVETFIDLTDGLKGERIGLSVFDSSSNLIFPLTNDYTFVKERLTTALAELKGENVPYFERMTVGATNGSGSSLIGDGLASCVLNFDSDTIKRSRSVVLATDNYADGQQIITLPQASKLAQEKNVRVYGINPSDSSTSSFVNESAQEFKNQMLATGGSYYKLDVDSDERLSLVKGITSSITAQEATRFKGAQQIVRSDVPTLFVAPFIAIFGIYVLVVWRLRV